MSRILTFTACQSVLQAEYFPPIELNDQYECALISFATYNSIPNVTKKNNIFYVGGEAIEIPAGAYEIDDISQYINNYLKEKKTNIVVNMKPNLNTLKVEITSTHAVYFNKIRNMGKILGFSERVLQPNQHSESDLPVAINEVNTIRINCNIISQSYRNNEMAHAIHEFTQEIPSGYLIVERPISPIYLPVTTQSINSIMITIVDQNENLIDFQNETIIIRLHLRPMNSNTI